MDRELEGLLADIFASGRAHDEQEKEHTRRYLNLETETARLMSILVGSAHRTKILEIGTSNGYSTIWLASAIRDLGGHIDSIDRDAARQAEADENLRRAGLRDFVTLHNGDATEVLEWLSGPFDCVFFDADRRSAPGQLTTLLPRMTRDALVLCDNIHSHPEEVRPYLDMVASLPDFTHVEVPIGKGLSVAYRQE